jgi:hypothetical protein
MGIRARKVPDAFPCTTNLPPKEKLRRPSRSSRGLPTMLARSPTILITAPVDDVIFAVCGISMRMARPGSPRTIAVPAKAGPPRSMIDPSTRRLPLWGSTSIWPPLLPESAARLKSSCVVMSMERGAALTVETWVFSNVFVHSRQGSSPAATSNGKSINTVKARRL